MKEGAVLGVSRPVSRLVSGTDWLILAPPEESWKALDAYWAAGGRVFDCAYGYGANSNILAAWLDDRGVSAEAILFDKVGHPRWRDGKPESRIRREAIREELARNHRRLGRERTEFLVLHRDDPSVPVGEVVDWLDELRREGKIEAYGGSNWTHERIAAANEYASGSDRQGFSLNNPNLTLAENTRPLWADCLTIGPEGRAWHERTQLPLFAWSSTARGYFARTQDPEVVRAYDNPNSAARRERAEAFGRERGLSAVQVALAWVLNQPFPVFALSGLRTPENVAQNVAALDLELSTEDLRWLEHGDQ